MLDRELMNVVEDCGVLAVLEACSAALFNAGFSADAVKINKLIGELSDAAVAAVPPDSPAV